MSTTDPIAALAAQTQAAAQCIARRRPRISASTTFLTLMTAQLKNQDPMKPLDSTEFVAQLAQFGTVSGVQNMQTSLTNLAESMRSAQALQGNEPGGSRRARAGRFSYRYGRRRRVTAAWRFRTARPPCNWRSRTRVVRSCGT